MSSKRQKLDAHQVMLDILDLYEGLLIPYMKIRRDLPFPTEPSRQETDGEHAFMLAILVVTLAEKMDLSLDHAKIIKYALIHDLVEAHAGDISARASDEEHTVKRDKEHEAFLVIKKRYKKTAPWIPAMIEAYEARIDEEAKFVYALDKQMGSYTWMSGKGKGWKKDYPDPLGAHFHSVVKRLRKKANLYPDLLELFDETHAELDKRRLDY